jgi:hypothetical protein
VIANNQTSLLLVLLWLEQINKPGIAAREDHSRKILQQIPVEV